MTDFKEFSDKDLLSTIICEREGEETSSRLFQSFPSLPSLLVNSVEEELMAIKGVGFRRAKQIKAVYELAQRLYRLPSSQGHIVGCPKDITDLVMVEMRYLTREVFKSVLLNTKNRVLDIVEISVGCLNSSVVHPRESFQHAIKLSASGICFVHNHPSGDPSPSKEDLETTARLANAGNILGIKVLDHIVIGDGRYFSFKEQGLL